MMENVAYLNNDICEIIAGYTKQKMWLYWIKNPSKGDDEFKYSKTIRADNIEDVFVYIFAKYCKILHKQGCLTLNEKLHNSLMNYSKKNDWCQRCSKREYKCPDHYPSNEEILEWYQTAFDPHSLKMHQIYSIKGLIGVGYIKIKEINFD